MGRCGNGKGKEGGGAENGNGQGKFSGSKNLEELEGSDDSSACLPHKVLFFVCGLKLNAVKL